MEKIASHMKIAEWKQSNLCKAHEQLHSEASSFLLFSLQWKDLETHFESTRDMILTLYEEVERREKVILLKEEKLVDLEKEFEMVRKRIEDCEQVMELKEQKLNSVMQLIEQRSMECELKEKSVESITALLRDHEEELAIKVKQFDAIQMAIKDSNGELKLKEKELETIQNMIATKWKEKRLDKIEKTIKVRTFELDLKEKEFGAMESKLGVLCEELLSKESELESIKSCIKEHSKELDVQEKQLDGIQQSIRDCHNAVTMLTNYVSTIEKAIIECSKEWELEENQHDLLQESVDELPSVVEQHDSISLTVGKCLEGLKSQKEHFNLLRKSIEERSKNLKNKENDFERRTEELNKKDEKVSLCLKEIESLKADMDSHILLLEKGREELKLKEIQHKALAEELESKEKDISLVRALMQKCNEKVKLIDDPNNLHLQVKTEEYSGCRPAGSSNTSNFPTGSALDGKVLLALLCEHLKLHDLVRTELMITLQASSDPAKLVLDAMRWFYATHTVSKDAKIDFHNVKRGCILLSELLLNISPEITPPLKEEALKLAGLWKAKLVMPVENHAEVVAFLLLVANFRLASDFNADELQILLNSVSQYKQAFELSRALGIGDKSSEVCATPTPTLVELEQPNEVLVSSSKREQLSMEPNEKRLYLLLNKKLTGTKLIPSVILSILKQSLDPAKLVLDLIRGSFHQHLKKEQLGLEENFLKWSTLLLKQLKQISPSICPKEREDAMKIAIDWKQNMRSDANGSMDAVGFLQLLVSYGLTTSFSGDEILKLFENIVLHEQASELCLMFGYKQKIQDIVQNLIGTKQFLKAVRFVCGYKLESFRPVQILNEYLQDARNATAKASKKKNTGQEDVHAAMDEAIDKEIDAVKSVISCVSECNLGSEISSQVLETRVVSLEEMRRLKYNSHGQPTSSTAPKPQPSKAYTEVQCSNPTKVDKKTPNWEKSNVQQLHPKHHQSRKQHPSTHQPHQQHPAPQKVQKKRKFQKFQNSSMKRPRKQPRQTRPLFSGSSPRVHDETSMFQRYNSRFTGMNGLFGFHEGDRESPEHGDHYPRSTRP
ncbi:hypothetical protein IC582_024926 [Cucumis melo]|uniref:FRIGIDA-like protein 5 isoform X1 n=1 Tax=Cucumis melo TaxID=3656 RepID=A0ABM3KCI3_CUCME|nr:FRIGIDA-like protein 5 isoform X1 [Cucumis melo]XP_050935493.1 FRIGIDA-like protein 5 isoform X1 [Cucumis melo]XP_050935494.1 FRIGIDA-like protein 5 isoform X1 [Cucumis melo]